MADIAKTTMYVALGTPDDTAAVSKTTMYVLLTPGAGTAPPAAQGRVHVQEVRT